MMVIETERFESLDDFYESDGFKLLNEEISTYCNCDGIEINGELGFDEYGFEHDGYIDHQSCEDYTSLRDFLATNDTNVIDYVFNNKISMIIDNDNH